LPTFSGLATLPPPSRAFKNLFIAYAMAFNTRYEISVVILDDFVGAG
jgi:hypothetical protein